jgi:hypothetical protein
VTTITRDAIEWNFQYREYETEDSFGFEADGVTDNWCDGNGDGDGDGDSCWLCSCSDSVD